MKPTNREGVVPAAVPAAAPAAMEATLLTREPMEGGVHADALAGLLQAAAGRGRPPAPAPGPGRLGRRFALHCTETGVELVGQRDPPVVASSSVTTPQGTARPPSTASGPRRRVDDEGFESDDSASEASSCCLVNDHVFSKAAVTPMASTSSDSANSSGASDTDEPDPASAALAAADTGSTSVPPRETFTFQDVVFCHVDPGFPRNLVLVVRRPTPARKTRARDDNADITPTTSSTGSLEALVFECASEDNVRRLCSKYQELSRRVRLESRFRRKEAAHHPEPRFNLQRTDLDGVTHITVALAAGLNTEEVEDMDLCGPSSIISISTPDVGNILQQSASTARSRTRIHKEIDGVIRADVEPPAVSTLRRQRLDMDDATITPPSPSPTPQEPPMRPERRRFLRKMKNNPAPQPPQNQASSRASSVLRGQFVRVSVDPTPSPPPPPPPPPTWLNHFPAGWVNQPAPPRGPPDPWHRDIVRQQHQRRSRSSDAARNQARSRSPPAPLRRPMAYRYVDTPPAPPSNSLSNRFFGLSQKLREIGTSVVGNPHISAHRRNSWGDSPSRFYTSLEPQQTTPQTGNLRSIVKNNKKSVGESSCNHEPKKVTFSAFATVQVMK